MREILRMLPDTREVIVVAGSAPSDHESLKQMKTLLHPYEAAVRFRYLTDLPLLDMLRS
jgi:hypothetical protein